MVQVKNRCGKTCFARPRDFTTENDHKRQVTLQRRVEINIKSKDLQNK